MLDESILLYKPRLALFDWSCFAHPLGGLKLKNIRRLIFEFAKPWNLVYIHTGSTFEQNIQLRCLELGLTLFDDYAIDYWYMGVEGIRALVHSCDVVYAPKVLSSLPVNSLLPPPDNDEQAVDVVCYFSTSVEPFTNENYRNYLLAYGSPVHSRPAQGQSV